MYREKSEKSIITVQIPNEEAIESAYRKGQGAVKELFRNRKS